MTRRGLLLRGRRPTARLAATIGVGILACATARAQCVLSGEVVHGGSAVPAAEILEEYSEGPVVLGQTNLQGRFQVRPRPLPALWRKAVLIVRKGGFDELTLGLPPGADRCPQLSQTTLALTATPGPQASVTGTNLFVAPYDLTGTQTGVTDAAAFNATLVRAIYNKVQGFRTQLEDSVTGPLPEVGVAPLNVQVSVTDPESVRAAGAQVNALGVVTGSAVRQVAGTASSVTLFSEFRVIPRYPSYSEYHVQIRDELPGAALDPITISDRLRDVWGKRATIALLVRALGIASGARDKQQLEVVRSWIVALRGRLGPDEAHLAGELNALKTAVEQELQR